MSSKVQTLKTDQEQDPTTPDYQLVKNHDWKEVEVNGEESLLPMWWKVAPIGNIANILRGKGLSKSVVFKKNDKNTACVLYGHLFTTYGPEIQKVVFGTVSNDGITSKANDVLVPSSTTTTGEDLACASAILQDGVLIGSDTLVVRSNGSSHGPWLSRKIRTLRREIGQAANGLTIKHLYGKDLAKIQILLPPLDEQQRIASILSTQEARIEDLRAWAKTERDRLSWLTDELLSGRVRVVDRKGGDEVVVEADDKGVAKEVLGAFELVENWEGWKEVAVNGRMKNTPTSWTTGTLEEVATVTAGQSPDGNLVFKGISDDANIDFHQGNADFGNMKTTPSGKVIAKESAPRIAKKGTLLLSVRAPVGAVNVASNVVCFGRGLCSIEASSKNSDEYLRHVIQSSKQYLNEIATGSTFLAVSTTQINHLQASFPILPEQQRISAVLTAQERQIQDIEQLITVEQKRLIWLTDELLSGRVRVMEA